MIGTPGGVNGVSTAAIAAPAAAAATAGRSASCAGEREEQRGERAVEPEGGRIAERRPSSAPMAVPPTQPTQSTGADAEHDARSKRAVPPPESAHDSSTTSCACRKRPRAAERPGDSDPDRRVADVEQQRRDDRGRDAAARAEHGDRRDLREPANVVADITIAAGAEVRRRASTPNDAPSAHDGG